MHAANWCMCADGEFRYFLFTCDFPTEGGQQQLPFVQSLTELFKVTTLHGVPAQFLFGHEKKLMIEIIYLTPQTMHTIAFLCVCFCYGSIPINFTCILQALGEGI